MKNNILDEIGTRMFPRTVRRVARKYLLKILEERPDLKDFQNISEIIYRYIYDPENFCKNCGKETKFLGFKRGYNIFCSQSCSSIYHNNDEVIKEKMNISRKKTFSGKTIEEKQKTDFLKKQTSLKRYGVDHFMKLEENRHKYSVLMKENSEIRIKRNKDTLHKKYGENIENISQVPEVKNKKRYDALFRNHELILDNGRKIKMQGYGILVFKMLLEKYKEDDILVEKEIKPIQYTDLNGRTRMYFPDILILSENKIIEVKAEYWYHRTYENNHKKAQSAIDNGFNFEFWVLNKNKQWEVIKK